MPHHQFRCCLLQLPFLSRKFLFNHFFSALLFLFFHLNLKFLVLEISSLSKDLCVTPWEWRKGESGVWCKVGMIAAVTIEGKRGDWKWWKPWEMREYECVRKIRFYKVKPPVRWIGPNSQTWPQFTKISNYSLWHSWQKQNLTGINQQNQFWKGFIWYSKKMSLSFNFYICILLMYIIDHVYFLWLCSLWLVIGCVRFKSCICEWWYWSAYSEILNLTNAIKRLILEQSYVLQPVCKCIIYVSLRLAYWNKM